MGGDQPYMYDPPSKYTFSAPSEKGFNPRAATQASWTSSAPRPKIEGPLIQSKEFNRHPDSYLIVPYGNLNWKPMSPRTKVKVKWTRLVQLCLRICALFGAAGMLFCVICIKSTGDSTGWIIRVPAAVAIVHTIYAIYHLSRSSKGRTPASSASYMLFASFLDAGLIPFYVFTALMARMELQLATDASGKWQTLFNDDTITSKIVRATFLLGIVDGSIHLVSLLLSIYLATMFRKIARLPPDMNPLEDNLTSRHKRNKSSLVDNRFSKSTTLTNNSTHEGKEKDGLDSPTRSVPFMHTRNDSHSNISDVPAPLFSPRASRTDVSNAYYDQPRSQRSSRINLSEQSPNSASLNRQSRTVFPNLMLQDKEQTGSNQPARSPPTNLKRSPTKSSSVYSGDSNPVTRLKSTAPSLGDSNWITHPSPSTSPSPSPPRELKHLIGGNNTTKPSYAPLSQTAPFEYTTNNENHPPLGPLQMNPPTPPFNQRKIRNGGGGAGEGQGGSLVGLGTWFNHQQPQKMHPYQTQQSRALLSTSGNTSNHHSTWGPGTLGINKAKTWGEIGGGGGMLSGPTAGGRKNGNGGRYNGSAGGSAGGNGIGSNSNRDTRTRVVSRSGVEVRSGGILPHGGVRSREVSGKIMEEGRGGGGGRGGTANWSFVRID